MIALKEVTKVGINAVLIARYEDSSYARFIHESVHFLGKYKIDSSYKIESWSFGADFYLEKGYKVIEVSEFQEIKNSTMKVLQSAFTSPVLEITP